MKIQGILQFSDMISYDIIWIYYKISLHTQEFFFFFSTDDNYVNPANYLWLHLLN